MESIIPARSLSYWLFSFATALSLPHSVHAEGAIPLVSVTQTQRVPIVQEVPVTGSVVSLRSSQISPEVSGRVSDVPVEAGDRVEKGALLAVLDPELARLDLQRAEAATREAREALTDARRRLEEAERLSAGNAVSASALLSLRSEVGIDEATLGRLQAEEARQRALVERHEVRAPFAGAISRKFTNAGEWVEPGTALVELLSTTDLRLDFQVPQAFFPRVQIGSPIGVQLDAVPDETLAGRVAATVPLSDAGARTFLMRVRLEDEQAPIIPGMSARARLEIGGGHEGLVVPRDALLRHSDGRITVFVLASGGSSALDRANPDGSVETASDAETVSERRVMIGRSFQGLVEILEGLDAGQVVVIVGNEGLQDGQRVRVREASTGV